MASFKQVLGGLQILSRYVDMDDHNQIDAQHDEFYAGGDNVSHEDTKALESLGWLKTVYGWRKFT